MAAMSDVGVSAVDSRGGDLVTTGGGVGVVIPLDDTVAGGGSSTVTIEINDTEGSVVVDAEVEGVDEEDVVDQPPDRRSLNYLLAGAAV